jgi:hypothetical protein
MKGPDRVSSYASSKLRQEAGCATTCCRVSRGIRPCRAVRDGFSAVTRLAAPDPASMHGRAPEVPHAPQLLTPPPRSGELRCHHVPCSYLWG